MLERAVGYDRLQRFAVLPPVSWPYNVPQERLRPPTSMAGGGAASLADAAQLFIPALCFEDCGPHGFSTRMIFRTFRLDGLHWLCEASASGYVKSRVPWSSYAFPTTSADNAHPPFCSLTVMRRSLRLTSSHRIPRAKHATINSVSPYRQADFTAWKILRATMSAFIRLR